MAKQKGDVRVVRTKAKPKGKVAVKPRNSFELLEVAPALVGKITDAELEKLIDDAAVWDSQKKEVEKKVKKAKEILLLHAESHAWRQRAGAKGEAKISPSTTTEVPVEPFLKLLHKLKKMKLVPSLLKVAVTDAKKYLGEDVLEDIWKVSTKKFGSVTLKELKK